MLIFFDFILVPFGLTIFIVTFLALKLKHHGKSIVKRKRLLILSLSGYDSVKARGIEHLLIFDNSLFEEVFFLCPGSLVEHRVSLSSRMKVIDVPYPGWIKHMKRAGFRYFSFLFGEAYFLWWLYDFIIENRVGVIRSMEPHIMGFKGVLLKKILRIAHIQDVRANFDLIYLGTGVVRWLPVWFPARLKKISRKWEKVLEGFVFRHSDFIFGGNKNNLDYAIFCGAPLDRSAVIRVNVQRDLFDDISSRVCIRNDLGISGKIIMYCGRLSAEKYPKDALLSFKGLAEERDDVALIIIGDGPERGKLEKWVAKEKLQKRILFFGHRDNQFLKNLFVSVDVIVCPLAGSVLIEAALAQLPIVAYDFEWHSEVVVDRYSGILVPYRDILGIREGIEFLLDHAEEAKLYGKRVREIAINLFHPDTILEKEKNIYTKILN
jgi:glycosyltransferase involved in cell wall biosynthesis